MDVHPNSCLILIGFDPPPDEPLISQNSSIRMVHGWRGAKMSPNATKVLSRIEALRGAAKAGVLSSEEAGAAADPMVIPWFFLPKMVL
jgi:hypothetical protein